VVLESNRGEEIFLGNDPTLEGVTNLPMANTLLVKNDDIELSSDCGPSFLEKNPICFAMAKAKV
jgi:hypothetical protein